MRLGIAWLGAVTWLSAQAAHADTASEGNFFDGLARKEYAQRHFAAALDNFLHVQSLTPSAAALYNVALCAELAEKPALAFAFLERYMAAADDDTARRADAEQRLLELRQKLALIEVVTEPKGTQITVDRGELGSYGQAPKTVVVDPGEHLVMASLRGYRTASASVQARAGTAPQLTLKLEPILGELELTLAPASATLTAERDGVPVALPRDEATLRVPVGHYRLRLESAGHATAEASVVVSEAAPAQATLVALPLPAKTGQLLVDTGHDVARLFVDGKAIGLTPATLRDLREGVHQVRVVATGKAVWSGGVRIKAGTPAYLNVTLVETRRSR